MTLHQFITIHTPQGEEWCLIDEFYQNSITNLWTVEDLFAHPPVFPTVTPFLFMSPHRPHTLSIYPHQIQATLAIGLTPLYDEQHGTHIRGGHRVESR